MFGLVPGYCAILQAMRWLRYWAQPQFSWVLARVRRRGVMFKKGAPVRSDLTAAFDKAMLDSKNLSERPDNATLLKIYALYKQGSTGDNEEKKPGFGDMVARAKWDAWAKLKGTAQDDAKQQYIDLIAELS